MKIAVLDDDQAQLYLVGQALLSGESDWSEKPECQFYRSGRAMLEAVRREPFDMVILDRKVPDMSGDVILAWLRQYAVAKHGIYTSVIMLTSLDSEEQELHALISGADDYITKPFSPATLLARVQRLLATKKIMRELYAPRGKDLETGDYLIASDIKRHESQPLSFLTISGYEFDPFARKIKLNTGEKEALTDREFNLALLLFQNIGRSLSRNDIFKQLWLQDKANSRSLDTHIHRLRIKLNLNIENGFALRTVYGFGYRLDAVHVT